jgi:hypothetical protein
MYLSYEVFAETEYNQKTIIIGTYKYKSSLQWKVADVFHSALTYLLGLKIYRTDR